MTTLHKKCIITLTLLLISFSAVSGMAQGNGEKNSPPFLINGKMPHMTKLLMQQWDNADLHLSEEQKQKLLVVRKDTIGGVQTLGKEIAPLENQIAEGIRSGKTPEELKAVVQSVAKLKTEATMVHLRCLASTRAILSKEQVSLLLAK